MRIGAVIVAAGLSSRMGDFKPLMKIGPRTVAQHMVSAFQNAGVETIAVVTGHRAEELRAHLQEENILFLHNEKYRDSQMFDSAKLGLSHLIDSCERIFFSPIDVPLFTAHTLTRMIALQCQLICPVCGGKQGHPLLLSQDVARMILNDSGQGGVKGAISRLSITMTTVEVDDPGILYDADTPEELEYLRKYYDAQLAMRERLYPSDEVIELMLDEFTAPEPIRKHCCAVAEVAADLAAQVKVLVNLKLLRAACLLHDIAKTQGREHTALAERFLIEKGYPILAGIVAQHHDLNESAAIEAELLYLADKMVIGTDRVSISKRFETAKEKCLTAEAEARWERRYHDTWCIVERYGLDLKETDGGIQ